MIGISRAGPIDGFESLFVESQNVNGPIFVNLDWQAFLVNNGVTKEILVGLNDVEKKSLKKINDEGKFKQVRYEQRCVQ